MNYACLQETEHFMPASVYYNEYMYAAASNQIYEGAADALPDNVHVVKNSVAWHDCNAGFIYPSFVLSWQDFDICLQFCSETIAHSYIHILIVCGYFEWLR